MRHLALVHWHAEQWERFAAYAVLASWAACWISFGIISALATDDSAQSVVTRAAIPALLFTLIVALSWRSERAAGMLLLVIAGVLVLAYNGLSGNQGAIYLIAAGFVLAGPPALAGLLFLIAGHHHPSGD